MTGTHHPSQHEFTRIARIGLTLLVTLSTTIATAAPSSRPAASQPAATAPAAGDELSVIRVFNLKFVDPRTVANAIATAWGDQAARVTAGAGSSVVVRAKETAMKAIEQLLERLDVAPDQSQEVSTVIMPLKRTHASDLAAVIAKVVPGLRECIPWTAANSLLLAGNAKSVDTARLLIEQLDQMPASPPQPPPAPPAPPAKESATRVFALKYARPSDALIRGLTAAVERGSSVVMDAESRSIIVTAKPADMTVIGALLSQIDRPTSQPEVSAIRLRVRFLWLMTGLAEDKSSSPPADLLPLVEELQRIGVSGLRLASQNVVETMLGQEFRMTACPTLTNRCTLLLEGRMLDETGSQPRVQLKAKATEHAPYMEPEKNGYKVFETRDLCSFETTVVAPLGKAIVAGVTPVDRTTSVFIVQVLPQ